MEYRQEFDVLVNSPEQTQTLAAAAASAVGAEQVNATAPPITGSEDFARYLEHRPGAYAQIGNGAEGRHALPLHNHGFEFNDDALTAGAAFWVSLAESGGA